MLVLTDKNQNYALCTVTLSTTKSKMKYREHTTLLIYVPTFQKSKLYVLKTLNISACPTHKLINTSSTQSIISVCFFCKIM